MAQDDRAALTIWRRPRVQTETGYSRSTLYLRIAQGCGRSRCAWGCAPWAGPLVKWRR